MSHDSNDQPAAAAHRAEVRGADIALTATEFRLLRLLMERPGRVQTRARLLTDVWGYAEDVDSRTVDTHVRRLRHKLGPEADRIETVIGVGYLGRFHAQKYAQLPGSRLVAVVDAREPVRNAVAAELGALHLHQACDHRPHPLHLPRWPQI